MARLRDSWPLSVASGAASSAYGLDSVASGVSSSAYGVSSVASGDRSFAGGPNSVASGAASIAVGNGAAATQFGAIAVGLNAAATGVNAVAIGPGAVATGSVAVGAGALASNGGAAFGDGAVATGPLATAIGPNASATATNSVAIGAGSVATAPNTVSFGSPGNERRLTNIAPDVGPTDAATFGQLTGVATGLQSQVNRANSGVAMAMAMGGGFLPDNKKFAIASNYGTFGGQNAVALTGLMRLRDDMVLSGSASYGIGDNANQFGGRAGVQVSW